MSATEQQQATGAPGHEEGLSESFNRVNLSEQGEDITPKTEEEYAQSMLPPGNRLDQGSW
ncbi:hypothetical protein CISG_07955 [Coccidioides immitis RMSCC 3703]|uniref:Uncharacterized protein n=1 Tax=Coccidioides immitis RMSCC 3703 TaxID=454286 RepID=A0A0J8R803_COCIT|nr:hypothetical protein CISG_07955 [Coccidioides immitis RMSCC 3703]